MSLWGLFLCCVENLDRLYATQMLGMEKLMLGEEKKNITIGVENVRFKPITNIWFNGTERFFEVNSNYLIFYIHFQVKGLNIKKHYFCFLFFVFVLLNKKWYKEENIFLIRIYFYHSFSGALGCFCLSFLNIFIGHL